MKFKFSDIEMAFDFVSSDMPLMQTAVMCKKTGRIYYDSELGDPDEDFPEDATDEDYFFIPHQNDLDLGSRLVHRFAAEVAPDLAEEIHEVFSRKGAYSRFKALIAKKGMLDAWHEYENDATNKALREWCQENGIELDASADDSWE